jgi:hypothetical protein
MDDSFQKDPEIYMCYMSCSNSLEDKDVYLLAFNACLGMPYTSVNYKERGYLATLTRAKSWSLRAT